MFPQNAPLPLQAWRAIKVKAPLAGLLLALFAGLPPLMAQSPPAGYGYSRTITIDHNKVPNTDQTSFPVLISGTYAYLATVSNGGRVVSSNGYDIVFTDSSYHLLNWELESY